MSAGTLTFRQGKSREPGENDFAGPNGTYPVILVRVTAPYEDASTFSKTGKGEYRRWMFAIDDSGGEYGDGQQDGRILEIRTSNSTSDKSRQYEIVTALIGRNPSLGAPVDIDTHLVGRGALAAIATNDNDFPYIKALMASGKGKAKAEPAPQPAPQPTPAPAGDELPF